MLSTYSILFAEDEDHARESIGEILSIFCKKVILAKDGKEALELYNKEKPDIVILDIEMPYLNGLEVCEQIRDTNRNVPIVIATAYTNTEYFLKAVGLNLTAYILKPIKATDLRDSLKKCVGNITYNQNQKVHFSDTCYYDISTRTLYKNEKAISLRKSETTFLEYMLKRPNAVISYEEFEYNMWEEGMSSAAIRSLVRDLRKYLPPKTIVNISRLGYKLELKK